MKRRAKERGDERLLVAYADGELDPVRRAEVERCLDAHPESRALVDAYRGDLDLMRSGLAGSQEAFLSVAAQHERAKDAPPLTPPVHGGRTGPLPVGGEGWGGVSSAQCESLAESTSPHSPAVDLIAEVKRHVRRQRVRRRAAYSVATACAVCVLAITLWSASSSPPPPAPATEAEARLAALNDRIANLERQVAKLETALDRRETVEFELSLENLVQEESAAIVYEAGRFYERDNRNVALALSRYRDVVTRFPDTKSAASAQERIQALTEAQEARRLES